MTIYVKISRMAETRDLQNFKFANLDCCKRWKSVNRLETKRKWSLTM